MIIKLRKNHDVVCTSRRYREVSNLAKGRKLNLILVGKHGGAKKFDKLVASTNRINQLSKTIKRHSPDMLISFCSPEAARIAFGLGIKHVAFQDSPHAEAVMRLTIPFIQKLLIPWVIPKKEFTKFGINKENIVTYKAIDAFVTIKRKTKIKPLSKKRKIVLVRLVEEQAAYLKKTKTNISILIEKLIKEFFDTDIVILARYSSQIRYLKKTFGKKIRIVNKVGDSKGILENSNIFIGSGGTMTAESALLGIPTISYNAIPNFIEDFLVRKKIVRRETDPKKIVSIARHFVDSANPKTKIRAKKLLRTMEDPYPKLIKVLKSIHMRN